MKLTVNGEPHQHKGDGSLVALLKEVGVKRGSVAIMVNGTIVRREDVGKARVKRGDIVELLNFAGGG